MPLARTRSVSLEGVRGHVIEIEADIASGLPRVSLVGSADGSLSEARDRCRAAVVNSGCEWPSHKVTIGLSPASLPKGGAHYDLAIAVAVLAAHAALPVEPLADAVLLGELALDGRLRAVPGVLPATLAVARAGYTKVLVPEANVVEAAQVGDVQVVGARSLRHVVALLRGEDPPADPPVDPLWADADASWRGEDRVAGLDLRDVLGQADARFALEVAAAGGHHLLLHGPPGGGKTMLAERLPGLLPDLDNDQSLEVSAVYSVAGLLAGEHPLVCRPPFLDPHHTASLVSVIGGGSRSIRPGAVSLAHHGVLFLDEAPEFPVNVLEALRQPLESGQIAISRAAHTAWFPARFQLVMAMNACPCGQADRTGGCTCTPTMKRRYTERLSGPIRDRIDIQRELRPLERHQLHDEFDPVETTAVVAGRVAEAHERQRRRLRGTPWRRNADVPGGELRRRWALPAAATTPLERMSRSRGVSARGVDRVLRIAWTLADLAGSDQPAREHVQMATDLRAGRAFTLPVAGAAGHAPGGGAVTVSAPLPDPAGPDRLARAWLSARTEPGDPVVAAMVAAAGAEAAVERLASGRTPRRLAAPVAPDPDPLTTAEAVLASAQRRGLRWVCPADDEWPAGLDDLAGIMDESRRGGVPHGLWVRGALPLADHLAEAVAVVGARASTEYGNEVAGEIAADLADAGVCVVSGAAYGVDAAAHRGALAIRGRTAAVLACGADVAYPRGHEALLSRIAVQGLVVSEAPPGDHPTKVRFLARNRLIAALSRGVVVVEAAWRSGALNTLRWAGELERHVMGVPGPVTSVLSAGVHHALREHRAELVTNAADVRELLAPMGSAPVPGASGWNRGEHRPVDDLDHASRTIVEALPAGQAVPLSTVAARTGVDEDTVAVALGRLLLAGLVERTGDGWRATVLRRGGLPDGAGGHTLPE